MTKLSRASVNTYAEPATTEPQPDEEARAALDAVRSRGGSLLDAIRALDGREVTPLEHARIAESARQRAVTRKARGMAMDASQTPKADPNTEALEARIAAMERRHGALAASLSASNKGVRPGSTGATVAPLVASGSYPATNRPLPTESRRVEGTPASSNQGAGNRPVEARPIPRYATNEQMANIRKLRGELGIHDSSDLPQSLSGEMATDLIDHLGQEVGRRTSGS